MALTILTDAQIAGLLDDLTLDEAEAFRDALRTALHEYSTGTQTAADDDIQQPPRTLISSAVAGTTTVFVPSWNHEGVGIKVLTTRTAAEGPLPRPNGAISLFSPTGAPLAVLHAGTLTAFRTALASSCLLTHRESVRRIVVFGSGEQAYWHVRLALLFRGATVKHVHIICRRLSETSQLLLRRFLAVPAAQKDREGWTDTQFSVLTPAYNEYGRLLSGHLRSADVIFCCTPATEPLFDAAILTSHEGRRKGRLIVAIGSFMRSMHELPPELLLQATRPAEHHHHYHKHAVEGGVVVVDTLDGALKEAGEIIDAGLTPRQLVELGELVMLSRRTLPDDEDSSEDGSAFGKPAIPSLDFEQIALSSPTSPTASMSNLFSHSDSSRRALSPSPRKSLSDTFRPSAHRRSSSQASVDRRRKKNDHMAQWLQRGNVVYKSVGLGLMDLSVGLHLVDFARGKGVGTHIDGF